VIVGFPGESDEDFGETKTLVTSGFLDYLHVFRYSDRPGTPAAAMTDKVPSETIRERHQELTRISDRLRAESNLRQVGRVLDVIAENRKPEKGQFWGIAGNYTRVKLPMDYNGGRGIAGYRVTSAHGLYVEGDLLT
jgi:threonylcarbamoyladenosine tRNA methylthiotransferase MtaB